MLKSDLHTLAARGLCKSVVLPLASQSVTLVSFLTVCSFILVGESHRHTVHQRTSSQPNTTSPQSLSKTHAGWLPTCLSGKANYWREVCVDAMFDLVPTEFIIKTVDGGMFFFL